MWDCPKCGILLYSADEVREATIPTKTFLMGRLKEAFAYGQRVLEAKAEYFPEREALVLGADDAVIDELANTTEVQLQSSVRYISATGQDHMRDGLLALTQGITKWEASQRQIKAPSFEEFGWVPGQAGEVWKAPWEY